MIETTQIITVQLTFIDDTKTKEDIKNLTGADDVIVKNNKIFELERKND